VKVERQFAANLRSCRKRAGLSQESLGFRAELHRTQIGLLERGARVPRIDTLIKLAAALSIPPSDLLEGIAWHPGLTRSGSFELHGDSERPPKETSDTRSRMAEPAEAGSEAKT
jgi:transcriptional regulator with XRE-family HTH domain